jgi:hypothetical protein
VSASSRVLDEVVGVGEVPRPLGQAAAGPSLERSEVPREEAVERLPVSRARPLDQFERRLEFATRLGRFSALSPPGSVPILGHMNASHFRG